MTALLTHSTRLVGRVWDSPRVTTSPRRLDPLTAALAGAVAAFAVAALIAGIGWTRAAVEVDQVRDELTVLQDRQWPVVVRDGVIIQPEDLDR